MNVTPNYTKGISSVLMFYSPQEWGQEERRRDFEVNWQNRPGRKGHAGLNRSGTLKGRLLLTDSESLPEACLDQIRRKEGEL